MERVLVVDDDPSVRFIVQECLEGEGYALRIAEQPSVALEIAGRETFDLVLSDVNMPGMNGFEFCKELRKLPGRERQSFLFMSGADEKAELAIARSLGSERLLLKPFSLDDLVRTLRVALGNARTEKGEVRAVLASILTRAAADRETGILTAVDGTVAKRFVFREGALIAADSNDPRDLIGQALLRAGVITERDLLQVFAQSVPSEAEPLRAPRVAAMLASMRKLTKEQCEKVFTRKIRESLLDVFLWETGVAEFMAGRVEGAEASLPLAIDLSALCVEGTQRRTRWATIARLLPRPDHQIERAKSWPEWFTKNAGDQILAKQIDRGVSLEEILLELRGQRYAVCIRLAQLFEAGVIRAVDPVGFTGSAAQELSGEEVERARLELELTEKIQQKAQSGDRAVAPELPLPAASPAGPPVERPAPGFAGAGPAVAREEAPVLGESGALSHDFAVALIRFRAGDLEGAQEGFTAVLRADPTSDLARLRLKEVEDALAVKARERGISNERRIQLAVPLSQLIGQKFAPADAFLLSRLSRGPLSIGDLTVVCPIPAPEILATVERFLAAGVLCDEVKPIRLRTEYKTAHETVQEITRALSKRELSLETKNPLKVGTQFFFEISSVELDQPLEIRGVVTWVMAHGQDVDGRTRYRMNVKYLFDTDQERARLEAAVDAILRTPPSEKRRAWPRIPTSYRVAESGSPLRSTYTMRNLSEGGMMLVPDAPQLGGETVLQDTRVKLVIVAAGQTHEILGTAVWIEGRGAAGAGGGLGVQFDPGPNPILLDLMKRSLVPSSLSIVFG